MAFILSFCSSINTYIIDKFLLFSRDIISKLSLMNAFFLLWEMFWYICYNLRFRGVDLRDKLNVRSVWYQQDVQLYSHFCISLPWKRINIIMWDHQQELHALSILKGRDSNGFCFWHKNYGTRQPTLWQNHSETTRLWS